MAEEISDISGVGPATVDELKNVGVENLEKLAQVDPEELADATSNSLDKSKKMISIAKQSTVIINSGSEVQDNYSKSKVVPLGIPEVDDYLDGGLQEGFIVGLAGLPSSGKTQMSLQALVNAVETSDKRAVYIESEKRRFRPERIKKLSNADNPSDTLDKIDVIEARNLDTLYNSYDAIMDNYNELSLLVIDSFTGVFRMSGKFDDRQNMSSRSNEMAKHFRKLDELSEILSCPVIVTGQVYDTPTQWGNDVPWGGKLFIHMITFLMKTGEGKGDTKSLEIKNHPGKDKQEYILEILDDSLRATVDND